MTKKGTKTLGISAPTRKSETDTQLHVLVSSNGVVLELLKQVVDVVVVDFYVRDEHAVVIILVDVNTTQFTHAWPTVITAQKMDLD